MAQRENIVVGRQWHRLTYTGRHESRKTGRFIECACVCGHVGWHRLSAVKAGRVSSCGCSRRERWAVQISRKAARSPFWKGHGGISATFWREYVVSARSRRLPFTITIEYAWALFKTQEGRCALSGVKLGFSVSHKAYATKTASLDRINPRHGYVPGNVQWVHKCVNLMKRDMTDAELRRWCRRIVTLSEKK